MPDLSKNIQLKHKGKEKDLFWPNYRSESNILHQLYDQQIHYPRVPDVYEEDDV